MDKQELTIILQNPSTTTHRLLAAWSYVPLLLMLDVDWARRPLVLVGLQDRMMWPLLTPGSLLRLDQKVRTLANGPSLEFERPIYLIEHKGKFRCCYAQRRRDVVRLIPHDESPTRLPISVPARDAKVRGQLSLIFRPLPTRGSPAGRPYSRRR